MQPLWLSNFNALYQGLNKDNLDCLEQIYAPNIVFVDPLHQVTGLPALTCYFEHLYENLKFCHFEINTTFVDQDQKQGAVYWDMTFVHNKIKKNRRITVSGHTHLKTDNNKVIYHRDYFDLGSMLYEQLPLLGVLIRAIKIRAAKGL
jgi:hypothetical protein